VTDKLLDDLKHALGDAYTIERELTGGGMSRVFVAREYALGREVVIKVLPPDLAAGVNRERFRREVQLAARLSHPYIVPLLSAGESGELLWFTMPFIPGESLRTRLQRNGPLPLPEVVRLLRDVVEALAYAHSRGVIHRDIKPGNILSDGQHALVTDFGVAKALSAALPIGPGHTTSGMAIGTPAYMAPEQLAADPAADHRVDIYAVGLLAYELLSGASPFSEKSPTATMTAQLTRLPEPLHQLQPNIPTAFSDLVQHCLAKSPDERPQTATAVLAELDRVSGALAAAAHRDEHGEGSAVRRASAWPLILATLGVVALVGAGVWYSGRGSAKGLPAKPETVTVRVGGDVGEQPLKLPAKPMTHADSLKIAEALRDELQELDSIEAKPAASIPSTPVAPVAPARDLGAQFAQVDSIARARYRAYTMNIPTVPTMRPGADIMTAAPDTSGPRRVMVLSFHRGPDTDSSLGHIEQDVINDLTDRLHRAGVWTVLTRDSLRNPGAGGNPLGNVAILVSVSLQKGPTDSVELRIDLRNLQARSQFGFRVLTSPPIYRPTSAQQFGRTVRDASRVLEDLRELPAGSPWPLDQGRGRGPNRGPAGPDLRGGGPYVPPHADSLAHRAGRRGAHDSLPR
jgi:hypothetical protein